MKKISVRGKLLKQADAAFREYLLSKHGKVCQKCHKNDGRGVFIAHILPKGAYPRLRLCESNVMILCFHCHDWWHKNPLESAAWLAGEFGSDYKECLYKMGICYPKLTNMQIQLYTLGYREHIKMGTGKTGKRF